MSDVEKRKLVKINFYSRFNFFVFLISVVFGFGHFTVLFLSKKATDSVNSGFDSTLIVMTELSESTL